MLGKIVNFDSGKVGVVVAVAPDLENALICTFAPEDNVLRGSILPFAIGNLEIEVTSKYTPMSVGDGTTEEVEAHNQIVTDMSVFVTEYDLIDTISAFMKERMGV
jgi:hypothetical protein